MSASAPVGSLAWARATSGALTFSERRALLAPILRTSIEHLLWRSRLALGLVPASRTGLDLDAIRLPDSKLAFDAEQECRETVSVAMLNHSFRTFFFGLALAERDQTRLDLEHLYVSALLHDIALESPDPKCCFAVAGGLRAYEVARRAGSDEATAECLAEAVLGHITPGVDHSRGPLAPTIAAGAMLDLAGHRLWHLDPDFVTRVGERYPREGVARHVSHCWQQEAKTFPSGRAAAVERVARFSLLVRLSPFRGRDRDRHRDARDSGSD